MATTRSHGLFERELKKAPTMKRRKEFYESGVLKSHETGQWQERLEGIQHRPHHFDESNNLTGMITVVAFQEGQVSLDNVYGESKEEWFYDASGATIRHTLEHNRLLHDEHTGEYSCYCDFTIDHEFNAAEDGGSLKTTTELDAEGNEILVVQTEYDDGEKPLTEKVTRGGVTEKETIWEYDAEGNETRKTSTTYDAQGNRISGTETVRNPEGGHIETRWTYAIDERTGQEHWIEKVDDAYDKNGVLQERFIERYTYPDDSALMEVF